MKTAKCSGRPRQFDPEEALEQAMLVFWRKGFEGTSLSDLTEAMGINRPSLYSAFGNKESLFRKAFEHYLAKQTSVSDAARELPKVRDAVRAFLTAAIDPISNPDHPGCLSVVAGLACGEDAGSAKKALSSAREAGFAAWVDRLQRARDEGDLPRGADPEALARYLMTVLDGMSIQARSGATRDDLLKIVSLTVQALPDKS